MSSASEELIAEGRAEGKAEGKAEGRAEGRAETLLENIRKIMKNFKLTAEEAMNALEVSPEKQKELAPLI